MFPCARIMRGYVRISRTDSARRRQLGVRDKGGINNERNRGRETGARVLIAASLRET